MHNKSHNLICDICITDLHKKCHYWCEKLILKIFVFQPFLMQITEQKPHETRETSNFTLMALYCYCFSHASS